VPPLVAESLGCAIVPGEGRVRGVFRHALGIELSGGTWLGLLARDRPRTPRGIRLTLDRVDHLARDGDAVELARGALRLGAATVGLDGAVVWRPRLRLGVVDIEAAAARRAVGHLLAALDAAAPRSPSLFLAPPPTRGFPALMAARLGEARKGLAAATMAGDASAAGEALARLIGLGPGLTPAGDDFCVGWLTGIAATARRAARAAFFHAVAQRLRMLAGGTTALARQHLLDACALLPSEPLDDLVLAVAEAAHGATLEGRLGRLLAMGASSGGDAAAGLVLALASACSAGHGSRLALAAAG
jgi:hypothetical protein